MKTPSTLTVVIPINLALEIDSTLEAGRDGNWLSPHTYRALLDELRTYYPPLGELNSK